jgi:hypothetical protein
LLQAAVRPIDQWGNGPTVLTTPLQSLLPTLASLQFHSPLEALQATGGSSPPPSIIIALESDAPKNGDMSAWRDQTFSRGLQIVQWTLLSTSGHPILLDAVATALDSLRALREEGETEGAKKEKASVLDLTGPGYVSPLVLLHKAQTLTNLSHSVSINRVFSDCVFRYILNRYGVTPRQISGHGGPVRVGDVVILPHRSMQADISERASGEQDVVWHGFSGRSVVLFASLLVFRFALTRRADGLVVLQMERERLMIMIPNNMKRYEDGEGIICRSTVEEGKSCQSGLERARNARVSARRREMQGCCQRRQEPSKQSNDSKGIDQTEGRRCGQTSQRLGFESEDRRA